MVKVLLTALAFVAPFTPVHQVHDDFTTFETASYFYDAFADLNEYSIQEVYFESNTGYFYSDDYEGGTYNYYAFPLNYDIDFINMNAVFYYSNELFAFYSVGLNGEEPIFEVDIINYVGLETTLIYTRLSFEPMTTYINNEKNTRLTGGIIGTISEWVTGSIGILTAGLTSFVAVFYNSTTSELTAIGILALLGLAVGLVTLIIAFVRRLFER